MRPKTEGSPDEQRQKQVIEWIALDKDALRNEQQGHEQQTIFQRGRCLVLEFTKQTSSPAPGLPPRLRAR